MTSDPMLSVICLVLSAYVFTRMIDLIRAGWEDGALYTTIAAFLTLLVALLGIYAALTGPWPGSPNP